MLVLATDFSLRLFLYDDDLITSARSVILLRLRGAEVLTAGRSSAPTPFRPDEAGGVAGEGAVSGCGSPSDAALRWSVVLAQSVSIYTYTPTSSVAE